MAQARTWNVLERGFPEGAKERTIEFICQGCGYTAEMPVVGTALCQTPGGIVFDTDARGYVPKLIRCRRCRRQFERVED